VTEMVKAEGRGMISILKLLRGRKMSKFTLVCTVAFMLFGCIKTNDQKDSSSDSAALNVAEVKKPLNACHKLMIFMCAETKGYVPSDCDEGVGVARSLVAALDKNESVKAEMITEHCQRNLDIFDKRAKASGFDNYESAIKANIASPEALKKFESSLSRK